MYTFRFALLIKSIRSCVVKVRCFCNLKFTNSANIHNTARWRCAGQSRNSGRVSHTLGMFSGDVLSIFAILLEAHCHVCSPHSTKRCSKVSLLPHSVHVSLVDVLMRFSRVPVGIISLITLYQVTRSDFRTGVALKFFHTLFQSVCGHIFVIRFSCILLVALLIFCSVTYIRCLYVLVESMALWFCIYAASFMYSRMYPNVSGTCPT